MALTKEERDDLEAHVYGLAENMEEMAKLDGEVDIYLGHGEYVTVDRFDLTQKQAFDTYRLEAIDSLREGSTVTDALLFDEWDGPMPTNADFLSALESMRWATEETWHAGRG